MTSRTKLGMPDAAMTAYGPAPILLVDDNAAKRTALKAVLEPLGHPVTEADSGRAALRCLMTADFAVILLDVSMPVMDGFETAALIRQRRQSEMTPIIFITAYASGEILPTARYVEGAVDFIFAPVQPEELRAKVSVFANLFTKAARLAAEARQVQASADQFRLLTDAAPIGIFQTDGQNRYVYTNPRWSEITGIPAQAALGRDWASTVGAKLRSDLGAEMAQGADSPAEISHRFEIFHPDAAPRIVLVTSTTIPNTSGGRAGWVGTLADITAEAGAEAAMADARDKATEASRLKSDFLANMSHEIRTPMNGVIGMTELLLDSELDAAQRDCAETVHSSGEALMIIIDDILDFSKIEAGKLPVDSVALSVRTALDDVVRLFARAALTKKLALTTDIASSVPAVVYGDPGRVRQVLTNLIGNAIKFTSIGGIVVRATNVDSALGQTSVRIEVSDTGDGVPADQLGKIFAPFVQSDTSRSRKYGGTGLGLAITEQLVALMGGECGVTSHVGVGSTFWFSLRVAASGERDLPG